MTSMETTAERRCLLQRREQLGDLIYELAANGKDELDEQLWQVFAAYRREIDRRLKGGEGSAKVCQDTFASMVVAYCVAGQHLEKLAAKQQNGCHTSRKEYLITRMLTATLDSLESACDELKDRFDVPDLKAKLAERIFFMHWGITKGEATRMAAAFSEDETA